MSMLLSERNTGVPEFTARVSVAVTTPPVENIAVVPAVVTVWLASGNTKPAGVVGPQGFKQMVALPLTKTKGTCAPISGLSIVPHEVAVALLDVELTKFVVKTTGLPTVPCPGIGKGSPPV